MGKCCNKLNIVICMGISVATNELLYKYCDMYG